MRALRAAEALMREELEEDSISRAYYAMLHAVRAALYLHGAAPKTHNGGEV